MEGDNTQTIVPTDPGPNPDEERLVPPTPSTTAGECPPTLSIRVALVGNEYLQQLPLVGYGGIEAAGTLVHTVPFGACARFLTTRKPPSRESGAGGGQLHRYRGEGS
jgi:hypothetical protein